MAENFCQLGNLYFTSTVQEPLTSNNLMPAPTATNTERGVHLVEHALINRKGLLQATGQKLKTRTLQVALRQNFCNVQNALLYFDAIMNTYKAVPLIWGNGIVDGTYMIKNISETDNEFFDNGALVACDITVELIEFVDAQPLKRIQQENRDKAVAVGEKKNNVILARTNKPTCAQNMAKAMQVIEMNAAKVDGYMQNYLVSSTNNQYALQHLRNIKAQVAQYAPYITNNPDSCIYHDFNLFQDSDHLLASVNFLVTTITSNDQTPGLADKDKIKADNFRLQQAVRTLKRTMQPYINKTISRG